MTRERTETQQPRAHQPPRTASKPQVTNTQQQRGAPCPRKITRYPHKHFPASREQTVSHPAWGGFHVEPPTAAASQGALLRQRCPRHLPEAPAQGVRVQVHERAAKTAAGSHPTDPISVHVHSPRQAQERSPTSEQKMLLLSPPALTRLFTYVNTAKPNHGKNKQTKKKHQWVCTAKLP